MQCWSQQLKMEEGPLLYLGAMMSIWKIYESRKFYSQSCWKLKFTHKTVADVEADGLSAEQDEEEVI